jgi:tetratricopeptide (TPR) repeat protein
MSEKKKSTGIRKSERTGADASAVGALDGSGARPDGVERGGQGGGQRPDSQRQLAHFEAAMRLFHARKLGEARQSFEEAAKGPERDVAQRAQLHIAMCDRRLVQSGPVLRSAEDYYNYGIALINARKLAAAKENLEAALKLAPDADHIHYALGLALALAGDVGGAHENLRRAIELEPRNRIIARQDADLAPMAGQPPLDSLLYPEKKNW